MKNLKVFCILLICALSFNVSYAQKTKADKRAAKAADVSRIVSSMNYRFVANYVIPNSMPSRALTTDYDVTVNKDKLDIYLPYFGRAYVAPRDLNDGGLKLKTTKFDYNAKPNKKGGWDITIKPQENSISGVKDIQQLMLSVQSDGYASLRVSPLNKQPISYNGYIEEAKEKSK